MNTEATSHRQFFDKVLGECEAGHTRDAVLMLSGMLDVSLGQPGAVTTLRQEFAAHPLNQVVSSAPRPTGHQTQTALTGRSRCLHDAVSRLGFSRGLAARAELGARAVELAWQRGEQIALLDCGELGELERLRGNAIDNIAMAHEERATEDWLRSQFGLAAPGPKPRYDLILATGWADDCDTDELAKRLGTAMRWLAPKGSLLLSAFVPGHLGAGWQAICLRRDLVCHAEFDLARAAALAGFGLSQFRDSSGSLIWAELKIAVPNGTKRGAA